MDFIKDYSTQVDIALSNLELPEKPSNLYEPLRYFFTLGGKRIRPLLTLLAAKKYEANLKDALPAALAVEIFHNFSLVHDDIMDEAPVRRGKTTVHKKWNTNIAILSGDVMLVKAYEQLNSYPAQIAKELSTVFNKTAIEVCEGQQMDMDFETTPDVSRDEYIKMIQLKTSVLLGCALKMGAILSKAPPEDQEHLYQYGLNMGIAFQIQDDLLDLYGDPELVGKQIGGDIIANKNTLLIILAKEHSDKKGLKTLDLLLKETVSSTKIDGVRALFKMLKVQERCTELMNEFYVKAEYHLTLIESKSSKSELWSLTSLLRDRSF